MAREFIIQLDNTRASGSLAGYLPTVSNGGNTYILTVADSGNTYLAKYPIYVLTPMGQYTNTVLSLKNTGVPYRLFVGDKEDNLP
jgi:hypothetical protein